MAKAKRSAELTAFEKEAKNDGGFFLDPSYGELTLTSEPESVTHYEGAANGDAWASLFKEIDWIAEEADGGMVGAWQGAILYLDNEGQLRVTGRTLVDHLAAMHGDDKPVELIAFCKRSKLPPPPSSPAAREKSLRGLPDPHARFAELERGAGGAKTAKGGSAVRPVDRSPFAAPLGDGRVVIVSTEDDVTSAKEYGKNVAFLFDPATKSFSLLAETPIHLYINGAGVGPSKDGRAIFVGFDAESNVVVFDPAT